jgi:hypothetical protein
MHEGPEPWCGQVLVESTARGPAGLFWRLVQSAMRPGASGWTPLFFPWYEFAIYRRAVDDERDFLSELDQDEARLLEPAFDASGVQTRPGLSLESLAWRRHKLRVEKVLLSQFHRDYPTHWREPFMATAAPRVFASAPLVAALDGIGQRMDPGETPFVRFESAKRAFRYYIGVDTAAGVGGDWSVAQVLREDGVQVAVYRSNTAKTDAFALEVLRLSGMFNKAMILVERNKYGVAVIAALEHYGANLWKDEATGNDFWTQSGERSANTKFMLYEHARRLVESGWAKFNDAVTVDELLVIVNEDGEIKAEEGHDDHADAWCLAAWCASHRTSVRIDVARLGQQDARLVARGRG